MWRVTCARTQASWWRQQHLSVSCLSLGSALITAARARLWSSFRQRSESPLLALRNKEARKSLLPLRQFQTFSRTPSRLAVVR